MRNIYFQQHHFREDLSQDEARELFRTSVRFIEIETFTYCNRKCWFCPNAAMPERQDRAGNQYMSPPLYLRILRELAAVEFAGEVQFGRYNEPLADRVILERILQARDRLPKAWLYAHTNGDFLTRAYLAELRDVGLDEVALQVYLGNDERWDEAAIRKRQDRLLDRLGLTIAETLCSVPGARHHYRTDFSGMLVRIDARNFEAIGTDRGGLVQIQRERPRAAPCLIPFERMYVDWTGDVMPCCNLRSDRPEHQDHIACRLQDGQTIYAAFAALHNWRRGLMRFGPKGGPCATCRYDEQEIPDSSAAELEAIYEALNPS